MKDRGRTVLAMDCVLAGAEMHLGRPLNSVVRTHLGTSDTIDQHLQMLEELLLQPVTRRDAEQVAGLLSDDFVEIGSSGSVYTKGEIIAALAQETPVRWTMAHFKARTLLSRHTPRGAHRHVAPNLNLEIDGERWRMAFHQGTVAKE